MICKDCETCIDREYCDRLLVCQIHALFLAFDDLIRALGVKIPERKCPHKIKQKMEVK